MEGMYTWTFQDGSAQIEIRGPKIDVSCMATLIEIENAVRLQNVDSPTCNGDAFDEVQWRLDPDGLHFQVIGSNLGLPVELKAMYEAKPWQKVEEWSTGPLPAGVWRVELTADDFARMVCCALWQSRIGQARSSMCSKMGKVYIEPRERPGSWYVPSRQK
jgi:hypothetical protein